MLKAQESNKESDWDEHTKLENRMYENPKYGQLYQELLDARWELASAVEYVKEMTPEEISFKNRLIKQYQVNGIYITHYMFLIQQKFFRM